MPRLILHRHPRAELSPTRRLIQSSQAGYALLHFNEQINIVFAFASPRETTQKRERFRAPYAAAIRNISSRLL